MSTLSNCPECGAVAAAYRVGTLGERKGVWCRQCGHAVASEREWCAKGVVAAALPITAASLFPRRDAVYAHQIGVCSGSDLDYAAARLYGKMRALGETDVAFRERLLGVSP